MIFQNEKASSRTPPAEAEQYLISRYNHLMYITVVESKHSFFFGIPTNDWR